jgi:hypothetical protein
LLGGWRGIEEETAAPPTVYEDYAQIANHNKKWDALLAANPLPKLAEKIMDLAEREASIGRSTFALQFQLDTSYADADRHPLKLRDLVVCHLDNEHAPERVVWAAALEWGMKSSSMSASGPSQNEPMFVPRGIQTCLRCPGISARWGTGSFHGGSDDRRLRDGDFPERL